jgi:ATP-dependent Clp protease adaptor protein ClpS
MAHEDDSAQWTPPDDSSGIADAPEGSVATATQRRVKRPTLYKVLLHNDDYTTMEFVVMVLMSVFHHPEPQAVRIMLQVHQKGVGVAGVYSYEVAEARLSKVTRLAREHEFPLRCSMEPD